MEPFTVRLPAEQKEEIDSIVDESAEYDHRSHFIRVAVEEKLTGGDDDAV